MIRRLSLLSLALACSTEPTDHPDTQPAQNESKAATAEIPILSPGRLSAFADSVHQAFRERPDDVRSQLLPDNHPEDVHTAAVLLHRSTGEAKLTFAHYLVTQGERSVPAVIGQLDEAGGWADRVADIQVLGKIGSPTAVEAVAQQLRDPSDWVRIAAAHALGEIGGATPTLVDALEDTADTVVSAGLIALGRSGDRQAVSECARFLVHSNARVRASAVSAIGRLGAPADTSLVEPLLSDPDPGVRYKTRQSMDRLSASGSKDSL